MRKHAVWALALAIVLAGCARPALTRKSDPLVVAYQSGISAPALAADVREVASADPLADLKAGKASVAIVDGPVPDGYAGFSLTAEERVLMQGWLDPPLAFTRAEAEARVAAGLGAPGAVQPGPGKLSVGRLSDLKPGWRAVPVDGVTPTPETVQNGKYPLVRRTSVVYASDARPEIIRLADALKPANDARGTTIRLTVTGDFMLARGVARAMQEKGTLYPVDKVKDYLASADITFTNLESPIGVKGTPLPNKQIWFRAAPEAIEILKAAGVDGVTVANNHILDYDSANFLETLERLDQAGIKYVGGGKNIAEARKPLVLEARGVKIAFLGYSQFADLFFDWQYPRSFSATDTLPGVPRIDESWLAEDIKRARAMADVVAVSYHWGEEFQNYPTDAQRQLAHYTADAGADLVLGFHPHAIQGFELYKGKFIAYSTGNFIMDRQDTDLARESMILDFTVAKDGVRSVSVQPVWIAAEQPYIMTGAEGERLLQKMRTISNWK